MTALFDRLVRLLDLRSLTVFLGLWLVLAPPVYDPLLALDRLLFSAARQLVAEPVEPPKLAHIWSFASGRHWWAPPPILDQLAQSPSAAQMSHGFANLVPLWFYPVHSGLVLFLVLLLGGLAPRWGASVAVLTALLITLVLVGAQLGAAVTRGYWLPLGLAVQYLWLGLLLIACWRHQDRWRRGFQSLSAELSRLKMQEGDWLGANAALAKCPTSAELLALLYDQGRAHEDQSRLGEARRSYDQLKKRRRSYRDVVQRLARLEAPASAAGGSGSGDLAQTLVLNAAPAPRKLGRYSIERELGRGAMGIVYLAQDPHIARQLAIKTLAYGHLYTSERQAVKTRFFREAEAVGRLRHPQIVSVYDVGEEADLAYIVMDYIEGHPLSDLAQKDRLLPPAKVYSLIAQVAEALTYAHSQQVVHRDIKPGNILYQPETGRITVTDFGIARIAEGAQTQTGEIFGSPLYMSPEQLRGQKVGPASDIFSLGVTFFQLLSGSLPFVGDNIAELSFQIVQGRQRNIRDLRPQLPASATRIINKALHKDPQKRYASATDMARALSKAIEREF